MLLDLYGSQYVLASYNPALVGAILYVICIGVLWPMRKYFEGVAYNYSDASKYGDIALIGIIMIAGFILRSGDAVLPQWAASGWFHSICGAIGLGVGLFFIFGPTPLWRNQVTDNYHNFVVMGLLVYMLLSVTPVILWNGSLTGIGLALFLLGTWAKFLWNDIQDERLDQRKYMKEYDPTKYYLLTNRED